MEEETVGVSVRLNQAMRQQFSRNLHAYVALNFQGPG